MLCTYFSFVVYGFEVPVALPINTLVPLLIKKKVLRSPRIGQIDGNIQSWSSNRRFRPRKTVKP